MIESGWTIGLTRRKTLIVAVAFAAAVCCASAANAAYTLIDDFETYTVGSYSGGSTAFVDNGGPWQSNVGGGTGLVAIEEEGAGGNKYLAHGWNQGLRGANRTVTSIAEGTAATYYFQVRTEDASPDVSFGLSDQATGALANFGDFEVQVALTFESSAGIRLGARNGGAFETSLVTGLSANTWYDIWVVVDNAADTYDVYYGTTGDPDTLGTLIADDFSFRNGAAGNDLVTFMTLSNFHEDNNANLDNIHYNSVAIPEPAALALLGLGCLCLARRRRA